MSHQYSPGISLNRTPLNTTRANNRPKNPSCVQLLQFIVSELKITRQIRIPNIYLFRSKFLYFKRRNRIYNKSQRHFIDRRKIRNFLKFIETHARCTYPLFLLPPFPPLYVCSLFHYITIKIQDYRDILILNTVIYIQRPVLIFNFITIYKAITLDTNIYQVIF